MGEIEWHRRETRRPTEKTNIALEPRAQRAQKAGKQSPPESEGKQEHEMAYQTEWGRVPKTKQEALPFEANDCCGAVDWKRHPAWTEAMRAALERRRANGGKWYSLIDRVPVIGENMLLAVNELRALESRARENRTHGSEGGAVYARPYPYCHTSLAGRRKRQKYG